MMTPANVPEGVSAEYRPQIENLPTENSWLPADEIHSGSVRRRKQYDKTGNLAGLWPDEFRDQVCLIACMILTPLIAYFEIFAVGMYNNRGEFPLMHTIVCSIFAFNFYGNLYKLMTTSPSNEQASLPSVQREGFRYCSTCQCNAPARAYHCPLCNFCVWKRDHHCAFAGVCVGYFNHRYYLLTVAYAFAACAYAVSYNWNYLSDTIEGVRSGNVWWLLFPHLALITRFISFAQFATIGMCMCVFACSLVTAYFLGAQLFCLFRGQTRPEFLLGIRIYDRGSFFANLHEVLGRRWQLALICPFFPSAMIGDGQRFATSTRSNIDGMKDL